ncbi:MAG: nuclear transport factor 2 family protein [Gemmatimonadaceae bacterium]|nr:nuclear transport factor 2 family protein [Gemmatimonadaceae bacterium]
MTQGRRPPGRRRIFPFLHLAVPLALVAGTAACADPLRVSPADRNAIRDSLSTLVAQAYDFSHPESPDRLLSLYPDSGRVISAAGGRVMTNRDTLAGAIRGFWQRVGQNMRQPQFVLGSTYVDVLTRDAAVMTITYSIPHLTPQGARHIVSGAWTMLWRRQSGRWMIVQEHLSDTPESTAAGPTVLAPSDSAALDSTMHAHGMTMPMPTSAPPPARR